MLFTKTVELKSKVSDYSDYFRTLRVFIIEKHKPLDSAEDIDLEVFVRSLKASAGYDFSNYSEKSLRRRVTKVLVDTKLDLDTLLVQMQHNRNFAERVVREITVNTTDLFRDPFIWRALKETILPRFADRDHITIWHAGCSTGQEVYSLLVLLNELGLLEKARIFGSDINADVLEVAKLGVYKWRFNTHYLENFRQVFMDDKLDENQANLLFNKYFAVDEKADRLRVNDVILNKAEFVTHDLVRDSCQFYNSPFDLVLCRNVVIYFNAILQDNVFRLFGEKIDKNSFLLLGLHESILGSSSNLFEKKDIGYVKR